MASRLPVNTSETAPDPAGSTAGPGLTGGAGGGGGGEERSGKNVGQLISRRIRARAPSIEVRWPGGGGPGGGGGGAGAAGAFSDAAIFCTSPLPPSPSPSDNGPVGDALLASFDDSSEEPSERAASESRRRAASASASESRRRAAAAWNGHPDGMADATTSSSSRAAAASTGHRVPFVPSRASSAGNPSDAKALACWAMASDAGRGSQRPQKGPRSSPWRSRSSSPRAPRSPRAGARGIGCRRARGAASGRRRRLPIRLSSRAIHLQPPGRGAVDATLLPVILPPVLAGGDRGLPPRSRGGRLGSLGRHPRARGPGGCPSTDRGSGDWYWLGDDGDASTETAPVLGHRAGVMLTSSAWFLPAKPGVLGAIGRWGMGPRRL